MRRIILALTVFYLGHHAPLVGQQTTTLVLQFEGTTGADSVASSPQMAATIAWVDSMRAFLPSAISRRPARDWRTILPGGRADFLVDIIGIPVLAGEEPTGMVVYSVTLFTPDDHRDSWSYLTHSVGYYSGNAWEGTRRIMAEIEAAISTGPKR